MKLIIDTTNKEIINLALADDECVLFSKNISAKFEQEEKLLSSIEKLLLENKLDQKKLSGIIVVVGPGGFSALRIGLAVANTLAFALDIPIVGLKKSEFNGLNSLLQQGISKLKNYQGKKIIEPYYDKEPNIG